MKLNLRNIEGAYIVEAEEEPEKFADKFDDRLYCYSETEPIKNKKYYWHYVDGVPTLWENELK